MIGANGIERDVTLRDARKCGHVPSVTTVLGVITKPALTTWMVQQGILAALTLTRYMGESDSDYVARVMRDSQKQAKAASEEGSRIHDAIELSYKGRRVPEAYIQHVQATRSAIAELFPDIEDWVPEASFAHPDGYGGKIDLYSPSTGIVIDFKSKDGDFSDGKRLAYDQHYQLAAYQNGIGQPGGNSWVSKHVKNIRELAPPCANIFVSRTHPGKVAVHVWKSAEIHEAKGIFWHTLQLWKRMNCYDASFAVRLANG